MFRFKAKVVMWAPAAMKHAAPVVLVLGLTVFFQFVCTCLGLIEPVGASQADALPSPIGCNAVPLLLLFLP